MNLGKKGAARGERAVVERAGEVVEGEVGEVEREAARGGSAAVATRKERTAREDVEHVPGADERVEQVIRNEQVATRDWFWRQRGQLGEIGRAHV